MRKTKELEEKIASLEKRIVFLEQVTQEILNDKEQEFINPPVMGGRK